MNNAVLEALVQSGHLTSYRHFITDADGQEIADVDAGNGMRETENLELVFPLGVKLYINSICSGSAENTSLLVSSSTSMCKCGHPVHVGSCKGRDFDPAHYASQACGCSNSTEI